MPPSGYPLDVEKEGKATRLKPEVRKVVAVFEGILIAGINFYFENFLSVF